jgi:hypothetical protein
MNRRRATLLVIVIFALAGGLVFPFSSKQSNQPMLRLSIVRRAVEEGEPVVFFRVEANGGRRLLITNFERVMEDGTSVFRLSSPIIRLGPLGDPRESRKEFKMPAPPQTRIWKLRITVRDEMPISRRFKLELEMWKTMRAMGKSVWDATRSALNVFYPDASQVIESDPISNEVTPEITK